MLKAIETENVMRNIIREIIRKCSQKDITVTENLASYMIKLIAFNPNHNFIFDKPQRREAIEYLADICAEKLSQNTPSLATTKMQVYFDSNYAPRAEMIARNHTVIKQRTTPLIKEILDSTVKTKEGLSKLYRKIVIVIIIYSGLGSPTNTGVIKETSVALQSVFSPTELEQFIALSNREKEEQIIELAQIVTGIRLFNRDCQKGGEGIEDLPSMLQEAAAVTRANLQDCLQNLMDLIYLYTTAVENCLKQIQEYRREQDKLLEEENLPYPSETSKSNIGNPFSVYSFKVKPEETSETQSTTETDVEDEFVHVTWQNFDLVKDCLIAARQNEVHLRKLLSDVDITCDELKTRLDKLTQCLNVIHEIVRFRTAIPTNEVYPHFIKLAEVWAHLQDEMVLLSNINNIYWNLNNYLQVLETVDQNLLDHLVGDSPILTDAERLEATTGLHIDPEKVKCEVIDPSNVADFDQLPIQFLGFGTGMLAFGNGALIPGNPNMGLCHWKGMNYSFAVLEEAYLFGQDPDRYILSVLEVVQRKPELIGLFQLHEQVKNLMITGETVRTAPRTPELIVKQHTEVQTELHPVPTFIDPTYEWNVWQLKKNAIQLANISRKMTTSTQTYTSFKKMGIGCQTTSFRDAFSQTRRDGSTNVPTLKNFMYGLRGRTDNHQYLISLTRPID